jgi:nucleotide-binding universal stress UspA family protein
MCVADSRYQKHVTPTFQQKKGRIFVLPKARVLPAIREGKRAFGIRRDMLPFCDELWRLDWYVDCKTFLVRQRLHSFRQKEDAMLPIKPILFATNFSPPLDFASKLACWIALDYKAKLLILHVIEEPKPFYGGVMTPPPPESVPEEMRKEIQMMMQKMRPATPMVAAEDVLVTGDAGPAITQMAQNRKCDLIVMGSHGRTGFGRLMLGSVAEEVLRHATCPVLTLKTPFPPETTKSAG